MPFKRSLNKKEQELAQLFPEKAWTTKKLALIALLEERIRYWEDGYTAYDHAKLEKMEKNFPFLKPS